MSTGLYVSPGKCKREKVTSRKEQPDRPAMAAATPCKVAASNFQRGKTTKAKARKHHRYCRSLIFGEERKCRILAS